ncbi:hypothetical protein HPB50_016143 [Hyalomma asiaticum]|uniref:Uncharacterized protein n=1 Tax=Hyalomma asiaticum TaxID=266040 RepID=A0ACB7TIN0_HYAAI|nr:hypothetical protein HPB50_016143 [Hyalomma asiaticum]
MRFSLLLLEPGEIYFKDYSVYLYPDNVKEAEAQRRRQKGRLKVCSKSILFVPEDVNHPILKKQLSDVNAGVEPHILEEDADAEFEQVMEYDNEIASCLSSMESFGKVTDQQTEPILRPFQELEGGEVSDTLEKFSNVHIMEEFTKGIKTVDGCYEVRLPWREDVALGEDRSLPEETWPIEQQFGNFMPDELEQKKEIEVLNTSVDGAGQLLDLARFSSATKVHRVTAWVLRFVGNLRTKAKSVKIALKKATGHQCLDFVELSIVLAEVKAVINFRLLSRVQDDPNDGAPLTLASFPTGRRLTALPAEICSRESNASSLRALWKKRKQMLHAFWQAWRHEYLLQLRSAYASKQGKAAGPKVEEVVLVQENVSRLLWKHGVIVSVCPGRDGKGLELYCSESSVLKHLFLSFKTQQERDELYEKLLKQEALDIEDSGQENMMLLWQSGIISNYDYLLYINRCV